MGAYKDKNGTWYAQFRFTNWKGEPDRKTKRGFATKKEGYDKLPDEALAAVQKLVDALN